MQYSALLFCLLTIFLFFSLLFSHLLLFSSSSYYSCPATTSVISLVNTYVRTARQHNKITVTSVGFPVVPTHFLHYIWANCIATCSSLLLALSIVELDQTSLRASGSLKFALITVRAAIAATDRVDGCVAGEVASVDLWISTRGVGDLSDIRVSAAGNVVEAGIPVSDAVAPTHGVDIVRTGNAAVLLANPVILLLNRRVVAGGNPQLALVGVHLAVGATHGSEAKLTHIPTARGTAISVPNRRGSGGCRGDWNWNWSWSWSWSWS